MNRKYTKNKHKIQLLQNEDDDDDDDEDDDEQRRWSGEQTSSRSKSTRTVDQIESNQ